MTIHIIGGGTVSFVRNHLALAAPAFGKTAGKLYNEFHYQSGKQWGALDIELHTTAMAGGRGGRGHRLVTNDDVAALLDDLIADPTTRVIILNAALCDYTGSILEGGEVNWDGATHRDPAAMLMEAVSAKPTPSGSHEKRLKTNEGNQRMLLTPAEKLIGRIRKQRKDIFVVGFKTTTGASSDEQYRTALGMLKTNSLNLVFANDTVTRNNMIVAPEETRYAEGEREPSLQMLVRMVLSRMTNTFTRSTVVKGDLVDFQTDERVPDNLRQVVNHLIKRGAYKPFQHKTAGHFAVKIDDGRCLTSRRKTDYTAPHGLDLVEVEYDGFDKVIAYGAKPSVGGQSQRIVFADHADLDCIAHFHSPIRENAPDAIPVAEQWRNECGSAQCGKTTSDHLVNFDGDIHAVMLDNHGPNIVFSRNTPAQDVIDFIERNFDVEAKTGGLVAA